MTIDNVYLHTLRRAKEFGIALSDQQQADYDILLEQRALEQRGDSSETRDLRAAIEAEQKRRANPEQRYLGRVRPDGVRDGEYLLCIEPVLVHRERYLDVLAPAGLSFLPETSPREQLEEYLRNVSNRALVVELDADDFELDPRAAIKDATGDFDYQVDRWLTLAMANGVSEVFEARFSDDQDDPEGDDQASDDDPDDPGEQEQDEPAPTTETDGEAQSESGTETETNDSPTQEVA